MNALIALAVWCQPHGPVTILTTQHRRPAPSSLCDGASSVSSTDSTSHEQSNSDHDTTTTSTTSNSNDTLSSTQSHGKLSAQQGSVLLEDSAHHSQLSHGNTFKSAPQTSFNSQATPASNIVPTSTTPTTVISTAAPSTSPQPSSLEPKKSRRSLHQPSPSGSCQSPVGGRPASAHPALSGSGNGSSCECQFSLPSGEKSLHSVDPVNSQLSYISQPVPVDASLFAPIRMACIRSLNSETYCGREGSVFFGDGVNGYVLSYMFTVYDAQSRGHRVKYTIMTMMTDRVYLVASMEYLISQFQVIASNLQSMANALSPPQQSPAARSLSYSSSHHRGSIMPENAPTKRGRPLTDVLAKPDIFVQLHAAFVSVLSNCSRRLTERHVQGRPTNECTLQEHGQDRLLIDARNSRGGIISLWELRHSLGQQLFNRLIWNSVVGNQVVVRGKESDIVYDIINALQEVLPKDCCSVILDGSSYEPSYMCNILGLDRSVSIPPDLDPQDFILLDICTQESGQHIATPTISLPTNSNDQQHGPKNTTPIYQASWSSATLVADMKCLSSCLEKTAVTDGAQWSASVIDGKPQSSARIFLLQAGEEPPLASRPNFGDLNGRDILSRRTVSPQILSYPLFIETVNDILDYKMPRIIESKRLAVLREEWISKSLQFHNLYKTGKASDESLVDGFLQSMRVDKRDLKILRFFTRCAKSSSMQPQKYRNEELMCN